MPQTTTATAEQLRARFGPAISVGDDCDLAPDLCVEIEEGGFLALGNRASVRRGTTIQVHPGATVVIGDDVAIGENVFISAMIGIRIGSGVGVSNMVDLHDHNHRERSHANLSVPDPTPWASGFAGAPIVIGIGAVLSNKVTVTAGVRIGQNTLIAANSAVTRSIAPNTVAAGTPARVVRIFDGPLAPGEAPPKLRVAWFGTSIMEHLEGYAPEILNQAALPNVGSAVTVESWRSRGYVQRLHLSLQAGWPWLDFQFDNHGEGGATSRDILAIVEQAVTGLDAPIADIAFLGCGINDVWRGYQGRAAEAVDPHEYRSNYRHMLALLTRSARTVICISETPFGWDSELDVTTMNRTLTEYNAIAAEAAAAAGTDFINVWPAFTAAAAHLSARPASSQAGGSLWSDGVHLSELGDTMLLHAVEQHLRDTTLVDDLTRYELHERSAALTRYGHLFAEDRK